MKPRLLIFASGTKDGGGSGFENLVIASMTGVLYANIVAVVSNHEHGGVKRRANNLDIPFFHFPAPWIKGAYQEFGKLANFFALSGWLKPVVGLKAKTTFNIHPGPLPRFGGKGFYGHHVHKAVLDSYNKGEIQHSAVSMHFVPDDQEYDKGPVFFHYPVDIKPNDTPETLGQRVNAAELEWQPVITNLVVKGRIFWDGKRKESLCVPPFYQYLPKAKPQH